MEQGMKALQVMIRYRKEVNKRARETNNNNNFISKSVSTSKIDPEGTHSPIGLKSSALL